MRVFASCTWDLDRAQPLLSAMPTLSITLKARLSASGVRNEKTGSRRLFLPRLRWSSHTAIAGKLFDKIYHMRMLRSARPGQPAHIEPSMEGRDKLRCYSQLLDHWPSQATVVNPAE